MYNTPENWVKKALKNQAVHLHNTPPYQEKEI